MVEKYWKKVVIFLVIGILAELLVFNFRALFSVSATNQHPEFTVEGDTVFVSGMDGKPNYLYVGINCQKQNGESTPVTFTLMLQDEGNEIDYELPQVTVYPAVEKSKYLPVYSYGIVKEMRIILEAADLADVQVADIIYDAKVPWFISVPRILAVFGGLCLLWAVRPDSAAYDWKGKKGQRRMAVGILIAANSLVFLFLVRSNPAFLNPVWEYHQQYHQLAVSLSQGKVSINEGREEILAALSTLENPYDYGVRSQQVQDSGLVWDTCYYEGDFYVYFGIVPVLLFYLPYFLVFHGAFPTWLGVFLSGVGIICGVYYLFAQIRRKWFPESSFLLYLLLSVITCNSINLYSAMLHADFYCLPILMALCFTFWGLGLNLSALRNWHGKSGHTGIRLAAGALCLALTAGCRPQFLLASVLSVSLLVPAFGKDIRAAGAFRIKTGARPKQIFSRQTLGRLLAWMIPYAIVAAALMFYNHIRFGSVFDFGANYNLTTNDLTHRGMNLGRLPDGIFMYLFQPAGLKPSFPFAEVTAFYSDYLGDSMREWTYGGAFWTRPVLLCLVFILGVKKELKQKRLYGVSLLSMALALLMVMADVELGGIVNRYFTDFLWLLMIPAVIVLFQLLEKYQNAECRRWIMCFLLIAGAWGIFFDLAIAFRGSGLINDNAHRYYLIQSFFQ